MPESEAKLMPVNCSWCWREIYKIPAVDGGGASHGACPVCAEMAWVDSLDDPTDRAIMEKALKDARTHLNERLEKGEESHYEERLKLLEEDEASSNKGDLFAYHDRMGIKREEDEEIIKPIDMGIR